MAVGLEGQVHDRHGGEVGNAGAVVTTGDAEFLAVMEIVEVDVAFAVAYGVERVLHQFFHEMGWWSRLVE